MSRNRLALARCLLCLTLMGTAACQSFYSYRPMTILARDAETGKPIPGAVVSISYPLVHPSQAPYDSVGATVADGLVHLRAAPTGPAGVQVETKAAGFMPETKVLAIETVAAIKPAGWFEDVKERRPSLTIDLYAEPRPAVELVLPASYRGVVKVEVKADSQMPLPPGQRTFTYAVPPTGTIELTGPALLGRVAAIDYRARCADGPLLAREVNGPEVGFWGLNADGNHLTFLVGTRDDFEVKRREALANDAAARGPATTGKGTGGGRRGGRGGGRSGSQGGGQSGGQGQYDPPPANGGS
jgi:uncharacterized membrane protein YgcG